MKLVVSAAAPGYESTYTIGDRVDAKISILINGNPTKILYAGTASAKADVYVRDGQQAKLKLEKRVNGTTVESIESTLTSIQNGTLNCTLTNAVTNDPSISLVASLVDASGTDLVSPVTIAYSDELDLGTQIMKVKDNRKAIFTITMDDGYMPSTQKYYEPWFNEYNLRGTTVGVYNCFKDGGSTYTSGVTSKQMRDYFTDLLTKGDFQIDSHSTSHTYLNGTSVTDATRKQEITDSKPAFQKIFPGQDVLTYTPAGNIYTSSDMPFVKQSYWAMRTGNRGVNSLDTLTKDGMYELNIRDVIGNTNWATTNSGDTQTLPTMNGWVDSAISGSQWIVEMWHTVLWQVNGTNTSDGGYRPINEDLGRGHMQYLGQKQASGDVWVATFDEATKYQRERLHGTFAPREVHYGFLTDKQDRSKKLCRDRSI